MTDRAHYILVYEHPDYNQETKEEKKTLLNNIRQRFTVGMKKESLEIEEERIGKYVFVKVFCSMDRLFQEAETMRIELPLTLNIQDPKVSVSRVENRLKKILNEKREGIQITAPFQKNCLELFVNESGGKETLFWSSIRCLLVYNILVNIDISRNTESKGKSKKQGLSYALMMGAYIDSFVLHDPSQKEPVSFAARHAHSSLLTSSLTTPDPLYSPKSDLRRQLNKAWGKVCHRQPVHLIRNYFGEKVAFYFAWVGLFIMSLWIPAFLGFIVFVFGVVRRLAAPFDKEQTGILHYVEVFKTSSDNRLTPCFAAIICIWGTVFFELWKRKQISLAHEWHVEHFDMTEPDRPQFLGSRQRTDPLTGDVTTYNPLFIKMFKYSGSLVALLFMVMLVFISVMSVILYRVYMTVSFCAPKDAVCDLLHGTVIATLLNTISIMILGKVYDRIAVKLTDWENHRTLSSYNDALIIKLYAFQFANTYAALFYTAFFRRDFNGVGILGLGPDYTDNCGTAENTNCMSLLSFQLLVLMIVKPFPKFLRDVFIPFVKSCLRRCRINEIDDIQTDRGVTKQHYLVREMNKPTAEDFRLSEFTEKLIQYGYLMLFAAAFPLAPLLALMYNLFDRKMDAKRLLWWDRRPTPYRDNDIGIWYHIINFINFCAVVSNAFLIAFNSELGRNQPMEIKLAIIIAFEHIVFIVKLITQLIIPDVPMWVKDSQKKERFLISRLMTKWKSPFQPTEPSSTSEPYDPPDGQNFDEMEIKITRNSNSLELNNASGTKREDLPQSRWSYS